jgi:hypothetical protein
MEKSSGSISGVIFLLIFLLALVDFLLKDSYYEVFRLSVSIFLYLFFLAHSLILRSLRKKFKSGLNSN